MGKTFRRGGSERGNYSFGKSIRDKRQHNGGIHRVPKGDYFYEKENRGRDKQRTQREDRL